MERRGSRTVNLIEFDPDPDLDIPDDMTLWSQTHSQVTFSFSLVSDSLTGYFFFSFGSVSFPFLPSCYFFGPLFF